MADASAFAERAHVALDQDRIRATIRLATGIMVDGRARALKQLSDPDTVRDAARAMRSGVMERLPDVLEQWADNLEKLGGKICWAATAEEAVAYVLQVARQREAKMIAKSKSLASEEIHLNHALEAEGIEVVETDLGEFIIQLAHETPSHIIAPAIHKNRDDVAGLFSEDAGRAIPPDIPEEAKYARARLREAFLRADIGLSGVNFAVADTGSICIVTNEGNGRMVTSLPPVHIAIMGMERIVRDWEELDVILSILARSATGQQITVYTNIITGPRQEGELDGPEDLHVIVLDNGRHRVLGSEFREALNCIRCGACLNACPVYRNVGGHSYGSTYSGPIGAVLTPLLHPEDREARELSQASSLCAACVEACPVRIPLADMLLGLRRRDIGDLSAGERAGFKAWSYLWSTRAGFALTKVLAGPGLAIGRRLKDGPGWAGNWLRYRTAPKRK